jgi:hypothetical protein
MTDLTETSLINALKEIQQMLEVEAIALKPTKLFLRLADLEELGLTVDDVKKMVQEQT